MGDWIGKPLRQIDELQAFDTMRRFLDAYWERCGKTSDDIAALLGDISREMWADGSPGDPGSWGDWRRAVDVVVEAEKR